MSKYEGALDSDQAETDKAQSIAISAASQIEDMRQTATARMKQHLQEAGRFEVLAEAHRDAAKLWSEIADDGKSNPDPDVPRRSRLYHEGP